MLLSLCENKTFSYHKVIYSHKGSPICIFICAGKAVFNGTFGNSSCTARGEVYIDMFIHVYVMGSADITI